MDKRITDANNEAITRIQSSRVLLYDVQTAKVKLPFLQDKHTILHSGPPVEWENMCGAMRNAVFGAMVYEGWAADIKEAEALAGSGAVLFGSANENMAVGPMAGIISPSMPVFCFKNITFGNEAFVTINEGLGKTLRFGANDDTVIKRLIWIQNQLAPIIGEALEFMDSDDHFFLKLSMGTSKATMDAIGKISGSCFLHEHKWFRVRYTCSGSRRYLVQSCGAPGARQLF